MSNAPILFEHVTLIGTGLIGASLARGLREKKLVSSLIGYDLDDHVSQRAQAIGVVDEAISEFASAVSNANLIILATPVGAIDSICEALDAHAPEGAIIMDVGSIKGTVAKAASKLRKDLCFVPAHPVAGTEQSGPEAGFASLFVDRWCILTPLERTDATYLDAVQK